MNLTAVVLQRSITKLFTNGLTAVAKSTITVKTTTDAGGGANAILTVIPAIGQTGSCIAIVFKAILANAGGTIDTEAILATPFK